jgi:hypothetical protein
MAVLWDWKRGLGWLPLPVPPGGYAVTVRGYREIQQSEVVDCGYEFVLEPRSELPTMGASLTMDMQVLTLPME